MRGLPQSLAKGPKGQLRVRKGRALEGSGRPPEPPGHLAMPHVDPPTLGKMVCERQGDAHRHPGPRRVAQFPARPPEAHAEVGPVVDDPLREREQTSGGEQQQIVRQMGGRALPEELLMEGVMQLPQQAQDVPERGGRPGARRGVTHDGHGAFEPPRPGKEGTDRARLRPVIGVQEDQVIPLGLTEYRVDGRGLSLPLRLDDHPDPGVLFREVLEDSQEVGGGGTGNDPEMPPAHSLRKFLMEQRCHCLLDRSGVVERCHSPADADGHLPGDRFSP